MKEYYLAWWNLENLFDIENAPNRLDKLNRVLQGELKGWTEEVLKTKISQLAKVICQMNNGKGPDLMGVCEVENRAVLERLLGALSSLGRKYQIAHHDTSDKRGIDVAFIYDEELFHTTPQDQYSHFILKRTATRDLFQVNFTTRHKNQPLIIVGNHWPSRSGGVLHSEPYRMLAGETLSYWNKRITEERGKDIAVVCMGDFNDEPFNRSLTEYCLAVQNQEKVLRGREAWLLNLMWPFFSQDKGTHYYGGSPSVLDQFLVSKGIVSGLSGFKIDRDGNWNYPVKIEVFEGMHKKKSPAPIRFGRPNKPKEFNPEGFSDHYPISVVLQEK